MKNSTNFVAAQGVSLSAKFVLLIVMLLVFSSMMSSCKKEEILRSKSELTFTHNQNNNPGYNVKSENLLHNYATTEDGTLVHHQDSMKATVTIGRPTSDTTINHNPQYYTEVQIGGEPTYLDDYTLNVSNLSMVANNPEVSNVGGVYYLTEQTWTGSFQVNGRPAVVRHYNSFQKHVVVGMDNNLTMPHTTIESAETNSAGVTVLDISTETTMHNGVEYKLVTFGVPVKVYRNKVMAGNQTNTSGSYDITENVIAPAKFYVKSNVTPPREWNTTQVVNRTFEVSRTATEGTVTTRIDIIKYYSDGTQSDSSIVRYLPFYWTIPNLVSFQSTTNAITYNGTTNVPNVQNSGSQELHSVQTKYAFTNPAQNFDETFGFNYRKESIDLPGLGQVWFDGPSFSQVYGGKTTLSETNVTISGVEYTKTTYRVDNNISFGDSWTTSGNVEVLVQNGGGVVTITGVTKTEGSSISGTTENSWITYHVTYSDGTSEDITKTQALVFGVTAPADITITRSNNTCDYSTTNSTTSVSGNLVKTHTINMTHTFATASAYAPVERMFVGTYQTAKTPVMFAGTAFERQDDFPSHTMVMEYNGISLPVSSTSPNGASRTTYTVSQKATVGSAIITKTSKINVDVEYEHPVYGKLRGHWRTISPCNQVSGKMYVIDVFKWSNGYVIYKDGAFERYCVNSLFTSYINDYTGALSATCNGVGGWMPARVIVDQSGNHGYWDYTTQVIGGAYKSSRVSYLHLNKASGDWFIPSTYAIEGNNLVVKQNGITMLSVSLQ